MRILLVLAVACAAAMAQSREPSLARVGTVGRMPEDPIEVKVLADGTLFLDGKKVTETQLVAGLKAGAGTVKKYDYSTKAVLIYADKSLPWRTIEWVVTRACGDASIVEVWFAVRHEGDDGLGAMAVFRPAQRDDPHPPRRLTPRMVRTEINRGPAADPRWLYEPLRSAVTALRKEGRQPFFFVRYWAHPRTGFVLRIVDIAMRAGVQFIGAYRYIRNDVRDGDLKKLVAKWRKEGGALGARDIRFGVDRARIKASKGPPPTKRTDKKAGVGWSYEMRFETEVEPDAVPEEEIQRDDEVPEPKRKRLVNPEVARALAWLAKRQDPKTGAWGTGQKRTAITALTTVAFTAAGYRDRELLDGSANPYASTVRKGLVHLVRRQKFDGWFLPSGSKTRMMEHAVATLAVCRAFAVTRDRTYKEVARMGLTVLRREQQEGGGWLPAPGIDPASISSTVWCLWALHMGRIVSNNPTVFATARKWLASAQVEDAAFPPRKQHPAIIVARFCTEEDIVRSRESIARLAPDGFDAASWYFAALAARLGGKETWQAWLPRIRSVAKSQRADGSWDGTKEWGGDVWATAAYALCLQVREEFPKPK